MTTKFRVIAAGDFGEAVATKYIRQALHAVQTNLLSAAPVRKTLRAGAMQNSIDFELPDITLDADDVRDWIVDAMRAYYGGPPFVLTVEMLDFDAKVIPSNPATEEIA